MFCSLFLVDFCSLNPDPGIKKLADPTDLVPKRRSVEH